MATDAATRLLGPGIIASQDMITMAELTREAAAACRPGPAAVRGPRRTGLAGRPAPVMGKRRAITLGMVTPPGVLRARLVTARAVRARRGESAGDFFRQAVIERLLRGQ